MKQTPINFVCKCERDINFAPRSCRLCCRKIPRWPIVHYVCTCIIDLGADNTENLIINPNCPIHR